MFQNCKMSGYKVTKYGILVFKSTCELSDWSSVVGVVSNEDIEDRFGKIISVDEKNKVVECKGLFSNKIISFKELISAGNFGCWSIGMFVTKKYFVTAMLSSGNDKIFAINKNDYEECHIVRFSEIKRRFGDVFTVRPSHGDIVFPDYCIGIQRIYMDMRGVKLE